MLLILATCEMANFTEYRMLVTSTPVQHIDDRRQVFRKRRSAPYEDLHVTWEGVL